jgi:hypothetical protein
MRSSHRRVGITALVASVWLVIGNLTHPIGATEVYTDGVALVEHASGTYWIINHLLLGAAMLVTPWLVWAWRAGLANGVARQWGTFALILSAQGALIGVLHQGAIDGVALGAYAAVLDAHGAAAAVGAETLRMVHLAADTAWALVLLGAAQAVIGVTEILERRRVWLGWLLVVCGALGLAFAFTIALQGHIATLSEAALLRPSTIGLTVWFIWTAWEFVRIDEKEAGLS